MFVGNFILKSILLVLSLLIGILYLIKSGIFREKRVNQIKIEKKLNIGFMICIGCGLILLGISILFDSIILPMIALCLLACGLVLHLVDISRE